MKSMKACKLTNRLEIIQDYGTFSETCKCTKGRNAYIFKYVSMQLSKYASLIHPSKLVVVPSQCCLATWGVPKLPKNDLYFMEHFDIVFKILKTRDVWSIKRVLFWHF